MRLINGDALRRKVKRESNPYGKPSIDFESGKRVIELIDSQPTVQLKIIRCKDCKHYIRHRCCAISVLAIWREKDDFCSEAERKTE